MHGRDMEWERWEGETKKETEREEFQRYKAQALVVSPLMPMASSSHQPMVVAPLMPSMAAPPMPSSSSPERYDNFKNIATKAIFALRQGDEFCEKLSEADNDATSARQECLAAIESLNREMVSIRSNDDRDLMKALHHICIAVEIAPDDFKPILRAAQILVRDTIVMCFFWRNHETVEDFKKAIDAAWSKACNEAMDKTMASQLLVAYSKGPAKEKTDWGYKSNSQKNAELYGSRTRRDKLALSLTCSARTQTNLKMLPISRSLSLDPIGPRKRTHKDDEKVWDHWKTTARPPVIPQKKDVFEMLDEWRIITDEFGFLVAEESASVCTSES